MKKLATQDFEDLLQVKYYSVFQNRPHQTNPRPKTAMYY